MREIDLWLDRQNNRFVQALDSSSPLTASAIQIAKLNTVLLRIHNAVINPSVPAVTAYIEAPLIYTALRASLTLGADQPPTQGTFCFQVATALGAVIGTSAPINWSGASASNWKANCLAAIAAISGVGAVLTVADLPNTPVNFFYYTWNDPANTNVITIVNNELMPLCEVTQEGSFTAFGYTQLVKALLYPLAMTPDAPDPNAFQSPNPPPITTEETQHGGTGINEVWTILVPDTAAGAVAFTWSGSQTAPIAISALTATSIASGLNAIVANGATNPAFAVAAVDVTSGTAYAVSYIGALACAAQVSIGVAMLNQQPFMYSQGILDLTVKGTALAIEQALNGQAQIPAVLELAVDENGEETILLPIVLLNDMTTPATFGNAEGAGAVSVVVQQVIVNNSTLTPFATAAPGVSYAPAVAVASEVPQVITHNLNTKTPLVWGVYQDNLSPERWRPLQAGAEFTWETNDANNLNAINLTCPFAITTGTTDTYYFGRLKFFISSPDAVLQLFGSLFTSWDQCLAAVPGGESVRTKFAAIDAALGVIGGSLQVAAGNITGTLEPGQIDLAALAAALANVTAFLTTLRTLITDPTIINNIGAALNNSTTFATTLQSLLTSNTSILNALVTSLVNNSTFNSSLRTIIVNILQGTAGALNNAILFQLPNHNETFPPLLSTGAYPPIPAAQFSPSNGGAAKKYLPFPTSANVGNYYTVPSGGSSTVLNKKIFSAGSILISDGNDWYLAEVNGSQYSAAEFNRTLFTLEVTEDDLIAGSQFGCVFSFALQFLGGRFAFYDFVLELGHFADESGGIAPPANVDNFVLDATLVSLSLDLTDTMVTRTFGYTVTRATGGALSATKQVGLATALSATAPAAPRFVLRARLHSFDVDDAASPAGQIVFQTPMSQTASIALLPS